MNEWNYFVVFFADCTYAAVVFVCIHLILPPSTILPDFVIDFRKKKRNKQTNKHHTKPNTRRNDDNHVAKIEEGTKFSGHLVVIDGFGVKILFSAPEQQEKCVQYARI